MSIHSTVPYFIQNVEKETDDVNPLSEDKHLALTKLKAFSDDGVNIVLSKQQNLTLVQIQSICR